jgi:O-antigen/teichoic acid export membrane protein
MTDNTMPVNDEGALPVEPVETVPGVAALTEATGSVSTGRSTLRTVMSNMMSLIASDVVNRVTSFVIYALVGRFLGAFAFGQISLALSLFYTFQVFAVAGLKTLVTREVAKDKSRTGEYLVTSSFIVLFTTVLALLGLLGFIDIMGYDSSPEILYFGSYMLSQMGSAFDFTWTMHAGGQADTALVIIIICLGLLPFALSQIMEAVFQAHERMTFIAYVNAPANVVRIALIFLLTTGGQGLYSIAIMMFISHIFVMVVELYFMLRYIVRPKLTLNIKFTFGLLKSSATFLGIDGIVAIYSSLYLIMLARFLDESAVGLYSSATQIITPLIILYQSIVLAVFPIMCQRFDVNNSSELRGISNRLLELLLVIAVPMSVGVFMMAEWGLSFLYGGSEFEAAASAVRVIVFIALLQAFTAVMGRVLVASMREKTTLRIVAIDLVLSFTMGILLIPRYGIMGAAYASLIVVIVNAIQHYIPVARILKGIPLVTLLWKPVMAVMAMAAYIYVFYIEGGQDAILTVVVASTLYFAVLFGLMLVSIGGPRQIKARYLGGGEPAPQAAPEA